MHVDMLVFQSENTTLRSGSKQAAVRVVVGQKEEGKRKKRGKGHMA